MSAYRQKMDFNLVFRRKPDNGAAYYTIWRHNNYSAGTERGLVNPNTSAAYWETETRRSVSYALPPLELPIDALEKATLTMTASKYYSGVSESMYVDALTADHSQDGAQTLYEAVGNRIGTITVYKDGGGSISLTKAQAENAIKYGIKLQNVDETPGSLIGGGEAYLEIIYKSNKAKPDISFTSETDGNGWTYAGKSAEVEKAIETAYTIPITYKQENGQVNNGYTVTRQRYTQGDTPETSWGEAETVLTNATPTNGVLTLPPSIWRGMEYAAPGEAGADGRAYNYIRLQIKAKSAAGVYSEPLTIQTKNVLREVKITKPAQDSVQIANAGIKIAWDLIGADYLSQPSAYDMLISYDGGAIWQTLIENIPGTTKSHTIPAEAIHSGAVMWQLRQKFLSNTLVQPTIGAGAKSRFTARYNPTAASVSCDNLPQPTVSWTSSEQKSYQVRFGDYDSGAVYSAAKSHTVPRFFADGNYPVQVRTQVASGEWSDWSEVIYVAITNTPPDDAITLTAERDGDAVKLVWYCMYNATYVQYIVYRNGVPIHKTDGGKNMAGFVDNLAVGKSAYFVRGITATKNYYQSETKTVDATPATDLLYDVEAGTYIRLRYTVSSPTTVTYSRQIGVSYQYFAGRSEPVAIVNGRIERSTTQTYGSRTRELADRIDAMTGRTVLFRDTRGGGIYGVIEQVQTVHGRIHSVTFTVREVYHNERVEYTVHAA